MNMKKKLYSAPKAEILAYKMQNILRVSPLDDLGGGAPHHRDGDIID